MKFRCEKDVLLEALINSSKAAAGRANNPIMSGLRLELSGDTLEVTGRDDTLTISSEIKVAGQGDGVVLLPAKLAVEIVRKLPSGAVVIDATGDDPMISGGRSEFSVRSLPSHEYAVPPPIEGRAVTVATEALRDALSQVVPAASTDESRGVFTGVQMSAENDGLQLAATDTYRLAVRDLPGASVLGEGQKVVVPGRALNELTKMLVAEDETTLTLSDSEVTFATGVFRLTTSLMTADYPDYRKVIPSNPGNRLTTGRQSLSDAVDRVKLMAPENVSVHLKMDGDGLSVSCRNNDLGHAEEILDAKFEGEKDSVTIAFNGNYLIDGLTATGGDEVTIDVRDDSTAAALKSTASDEFLYVLMPVKVT